MGCITLNALAQSPQLNPSVINKKQVLAVISSPLPKKKTKEKEKTSSAFEIFRELRNAELAPFMDVTNNISHLISTHQIYAQIYEAQYFQG